MTTILYTPFYWIKTLFKHLWLSISSIKYYQNIFSSYKGYGLEYILIISFLSSLICSAFFLDRMNKIRKYLRDNIISESVVNIDHIISQFPDLNYNGKTLSATEDTPLYLSNTNNTKIVVIDPENKLNNNDRSQIPILLSSSNILISLVDSEGNLRNTFPIKYPQIFGTAPQTLTQELVKASLAVIFDKAPTILIYFIFPLLALLIFINALIEKSFIIALLYLITHLLAIKVSLKTCIRMVLFASSLFILLQPITIMLIPSLSKVLWLLQIWTNLLMVIGILKTVNRLTFWKK